MKPNRDPSPHHYYISEYLEARAGIKLLSDFNFFSEDMRIDFKPIEIRGKSLQDCIELMEKYIRGRLILEDIKIHGDIILATAYMNTTSMEATKDIFRQGTVVATKAIYRLYPIYKS